MALSGRVLFIFIRWSFWFSPYPCCCINWVWKNFSSFWFCALTRLNCMMVCSWTLWRGLNHVFISFRLFNEKSISRIQFWWNQITRNNFFRSANIDFPTTTITNGIIKNINEHLIIILDNYHLLFLIPVIDQFLCDFV